MIDKSELRFETLDSNHEVPYFWDDLQELWLSCSQSIMSCGRNANAVNTFLHVDNGAVMTSTHGFEIPYDAQLVWMTAAAKNSGTPGSTCTLDLYNGGFSILNTAWTITPYKVTLNLGVPAGNLSIRIGSLTAPGDRPDQPNVHVGLRWKLP